MNRVDIKELNRQRVYQLVYQENQISKPTISAKLKISLPTVSQCVNELIERGWCLKKDILNQQAGEKRQLSP